MPTVESQAKVCPPLPHSETVADAPALSRPAAQTDNAPAQVPQPQNLQNAKVAVCGQELRRHASSRFERYTERPCAEPPRRDLLEGHGAWCALEQLRPLTGEKNEIIMVILHCRCRRGLDAAVGWRCARPA